MLEPVEVAVKCRFLIYRNRVQTETDILVGKREDVLRRVNGQWKITQRKVILDQNVLLAKNLTFFSREDGAMAASGKSGYQYGLVDMSTGQVSREIFVNEDIYQQEMERVFTRAWLFVGHESQIPKAGDYFVSSMGEESVLLCRDREEAIHVFLNSCRHQGMKVCRYDEGHPSLHLPLSWLELRRRWPAGRRTLFQRSLSRQAGQVAVGIGRGGPVVQL